LTGEWAVLVRTFIEKRLTFSENPENAMVENFVSHTLTCNTTTRAIVEGTDLDSIVIELDTNLEASWSLAVTTMRLLGVIRE
jgi:hypothetical protein